MGAHSASGGRRRSGVHVEGPAPEATATPRRGRHASAAPAVETVEAAPVTASVLAATVQSLAVDAVAEENKAVDALLADAPAPEAAPAAATEIADEVVDLPPRTARRRRAAQSLGRALRWTVAGALVPGLAHLAAGRRRIGLVMSGSFATLLIATGVLFAAVPHTRLMQVSVKTGELQLVMVLCMALALIWVLVVVSSWSVHKPDHLRMGQRLGATGVVALLSLGVATPFAVGARTAHTQIDLLNSLFPDEEPDIAMPGPTPTPQPPGFGAPTGYFANKPRVNVLLLGGDGDEDRKGVRTDTMILASIDTKSGRTVLISLPRNLNKVQFPPGTEMARRFPNGFNDMMNAVYDYAENDPAVMPGSKHPGADLVKQAFAWTIAQPVDYFVLVNLDGFQDIVDAFGGVTINVDRRLPIGGAHDANGNVTEQPHAYLEPGKRKLSGYEALWYGRSRFDSDDYARMNRQRCLLGAIAKQASPIKVLTNFTQLAGAAKRIILTDIPKKALPDLLLLANKAKKIKITSVTFTHTSAFDPATPSFIYIQEQVRLALDEATKKPAASTTPSVSPTASATPGTGKKKGTKATTAPPAPKSSAAGLDSVCEY
jgi:LCP family protein required for cell wall assembly